MLRNTVVDAASAVSSDSAPVVEVEALNGTMDDDGDEDPAAQLAHGPDDLERLAHGVHADELDGVDQPEDVGAQKVQVTGDSKEALFQEAEGEAGRRPRGLTSPAAPTPEEYATHVLTHMPYRSWCWHCVASRRPNAAHRRSNREKDRNIPS